MDRAARRTRPPSTRFLCTRGDGPRARPPKKRSLSFLCTRGDGPARLTRPNTMNRFLCTRGDGPIRISRGGVCVGFSLHARRWTARASCPAPGRGCFLCTRGDGPPVQATIHGPRDRFLCTRGDGPPVLCRVDQLERFLCTRGDGPYRRAVLLGGVEFSLHARRWTGGFCAHVNRKSVFSARAEMDRLGLGEPEHTDRFLCTRGDGPCFCRWRPAL